MAALGERRGLTDHLEEAIRDALKSRVALGKLDEVTGAVLGALRSRFVIGTRRPRPRRTTQRAMSLLLPDVGVEVKGTHRDRKYTLRVMGERMVELDFEGRTEQYPSLKAVAVAICGYSPSVGGWRFFFGNQELDEVNARFKVKP